MRTLITVSFSLTLFLLFAGFFSVYADHGPRSFWNTQDWSEEEQVQKTLDYLDNREDEYPSFYTSDEQRHLADVKRLFNTARVIFVLLTVILIAAWSKKPKDWTRKVLLYGGVGGLGLVLLLALTALLDFSWFWSRVFHPLLFPQGNWQFPPGSLLTTLFPEAFFKAFATQTLLATASFSTLSILTALTLAGRT